MQLKRNSFSFEKFAQIPNISLAADFLHAKSQQILVDRFWMMERTHLFQNEDVGYSEAHELGKPSSINLIAKTEFVVVHSTRKVVLSLRAYMIYFQLCCGRMKCIKPV